MRKKKEIKKKEEKILVIGPEGNYEIPKIRMDRFEYKISD